MLDLVFVGLSVLFFVAGGGIRRGLPAAGVRSRQ